MENQHAHIVNLKNGEYNYQIQVKFTDQHKLILTIQNRNKQTHYENIFSLLKLKKLCPIFISCQSIKQASNRLLKKLQQKKADIEEKQKQMFLTINYKIDDIEHKSSIKLLKLNQDIVDVQNLKQLKIRSAQPKDVSLILSLIKQLALYQKQHESVLITEKQLLQEVFGDKPHAKFVILQYNSIPIGYANYLYTFFSWTGKGLYLDDIYVKQEYRGIGIGKNVFAYLANDAINNNCTRMEWIVLDWNEPSKQFYNRLGAGQFQGWLFYKMPRKSIQKLAVMNHY